MDILKTSVRFTKEHPHLMKLFSVAFVVAIGIVAALGIVAHKSYAQGTLPFGGLSTFIKYCDCSGPGVIAVTVQDLSTSPGSPPNYIYYPGGTVLYEFGQIYQTGVWLLGNRTTAGVCLYYAGKSCAVWPTSGTMTIVGTSQ